MLLLLLLCKLFQVYYHFMVSAHTSGSLYRLVTRNYSCLSLCICRFCFSLTHKHSHDLSLSLTHTQTKNALTPAFQPLLHFYFGHLHFNREWFLEFLVHVSVIVVSALRSIADFSISIVLLPLLLVFVVCGRSRVGPHQSWWSLIFYHLFHSFYSFYTAHLIPNPKGKCYFVCICLSNTFHLAFLNRRLLQKYG